MKSRLNLIAAALVVLLGSMVWLVEDRGRSVAPPAMAASEPSALDRGNAHAPAVAPAETTASAPAPAPAPAAAQREAAPVVNVDSSGRGTYAARDGDTVSHLAAALFGTSTIASRDAVVAANPSLQANPDFVLTGKDYSTTPAAGHAEVAADIDDQQRNAAPPAVTARATVSSRAAEGSTDAGRVAADAPTEAAAAAAAGPKMEYVAQAGDTVRGLAAGFLGGDTQRNRDAIIDGNASLQANPDRMVVGQSYSIVARNGLSVDANAPQAKGPTTQPGADEVARLSMGRALRYTAVSGDTVSKLALTLLGADTATNRDLIIQSNPSLKAAPDHLSAGQTYWIPAPTVEQTR